MKIAICDDDLQELNQISSCIDEYRRERKVPLTYEAFRSAEELVAKVSGGDYDILFLDILMPEINGMQAAHEIRAFNSRMKIVFLTSS
ncbi:MAG TPA: response regulator, partial [Clostridiales bacterium]|nr:response regulator [Clostridiales bacterium]